MRHRGTCRHVLAQLAVEQGNLAESVRLYQAAIEQIEELIQRVPIDATYVYDLQRYCVEYASALLELAQPFQAYAHLIAARDAMEELIAETPDRPQFVELHAKAERLIHSIEQ